MERRNLFADGMSALAGVVADEKTRARLSWAYANEYWLKAGPMDPLPWFAFHHADDFQRRLIQQGAAVSYYDDFGEWPWYR